MVGGKPIDRHSDLVVNCRGLNTTKTLGCVPQQFLQGSAWQVVDFRGSLLELFS